MQEVPTKVEEEDKEKGADEPTLEVKTEGWKNRLLGTHKEKNVLFELSFFSLDGKI